ncbi:MAG: cobalt-precorrin-5B (C(1))-methyltransferase CbiD [Methanobrevibacter sp.]|jgi:cobalt-precorrin-5B (C1)-methyltransferase|nr:cobalt-precorrin-5B (C(1))-methyltransferase CbiD [Candidatus Methanoflexus mossambicus]
MKNKTSIFDKNKKKNLSLGISTGTIATATAIVALKSLIDHNSENLNCVEVKAPYGQLFVEISEIKKVNSFKSIASAVKYPYYDPDVTVNHKISSAIELKDKTSEDNEKIQIIGGSGVGIVTKPGLQVEVGKPAINPVPQKMIKDNLNELIPKDKIAIVEISVENGAEIAKKTMNPRLGIIGGISILGTTGIAKSFDDESWKKSLICQLDIAIAQKVNKLIFVPGNIGEKYAIKHLNANKDQIIQMGNFVGFMFQNAKEKGIEELILFGHIGKLVKIAGGIFNTANKIADSRREIFTCHTALCRGSLEIIHQIYNSKTSEDMLAILKKENLDKKVLKSISNSIIEIIKNRYNITINLIIIDIKGNILIKT